MNRLAHLWRTQRVLVASFALALVVMLFFAVRTATFWVYWSDPARRDMAVEGWMTPGYVARSYRVERSVVADALGLEAGAQARQTLAALAAERGVPLAALEAALLEAIAGARAGQ